MIWNVFFFFGWREAWDLIYLSEKWSDTEEKENGGLASAGSLPECSQEPGLGHTELRKDSGARSRAALLELLSF